MNLLKKEKHFECYLGRCSIQISLKAYNREATRTNLERNRNNLKHVDAIAFRNCYFWQMHPLATTSTTVGDFCACHISTALK